MQSTDTIEPTDTTEAADGMKTVIYQGQPVRATLVNYLSGTIPTSTVDAEGDEELFRDEAGRYYLRRTLNLKADYHEDGGEGNVEASGRTLVHRLNVNAAILWATTRLNSETLHLRRDAAELLMENRGYSDPHPSHLNAEKRIMIQHAGRLVDTKAVSESPDTVTVPLTLPLALYRQVLALGAYDGRASFGETALLSVRSEAQAWLEQDDEAPDYLCQYENELDAGLHPQLWPPASAASSHQEQGPAPGRVVVELDELASMMLRQTCREGGESQQPGEDPRDLVNAAVTYYLCGNADSQHGEHDLNDGSEALARAKTTRLALEAKASSPEALHAVTIHLTPTQFGMVERVARFDHAPSVAAWVLREVESMVVCTADSFGEDQDATRAAWNQTKEAP